MCDVLYTIIHHSHSIRSYLSRRAGVCKLSNQESRRVWAASWQILGCRLLQSVARVHLVQRRDAGPLYYCPGVCPGGPASWLFLVRPKGNDNDNDN